MEMDATMWCPFFLSCIFLAFIVYNWRITLESIKMV